MHLSMHPSITFSMFFFCFFSYFVFVYLSFPLPLLQFRGKVAGALSSLPVKDFDGVAMKGEALNSLTQATGEVDEDAQVLIFSYPK